MARLVVRINDYEFSREFGVPRESMALGWGLATMVLLMMIAAYWGPNPFKRELTIRSTS